MAIQLKKREIFLVEAKVVDATGAYNNVPGYPQEFDSKFNDNDVEKAMNKAYAAFESAASAGHTAAANGRPLTVVSLVRIGDGKQLEKKAIGKIPDIEIEVPDPEPEPEPEGEPEGE